MNDDIIAPGKGFGTHPHDQWRLSLYLYKGVRTQRQHGKRGVIEKDEIQVMSTGTGVLTVNTIKVKKNQ